MSRLTRALVGAVASCALAMIAAPSLAGTTHSYTYQAGSYSGSRDRQYKVYVPDNVATPAPMVMTLHGCGQTHDDVLNDWGMKEAADQYGFILVAPFITSYDGMRSENCWGFWFDQHTHEGQGEPEDLHQIGLEVESNFSIDANRRYITGLSSGGAMTAVVAITHNEYFAAAAPAAGLVYGETSSSVSLSGCYGSPTMESTVTSANDIERELDDAYPIPTMILQNNEDCVVQQPAGRNMRDAHLRVFGGSEAQDVACEDYYQNNYGCRHVYYTSDGVVGSRSVVETVFFDGPLQTPATGDNDYGHYWVAGANGNEAEYNKKVGPSYPDLVWDFFSRHSRDGSGGPVSDGKPQITLNGDNPMEVTLGGSFTDPGASATDAEDGSVAVSADCDVDTSTAGEYYCTYTAEDSAGNVASVSRTVIVVDPNAPTESCAEATASPSAHISAGRAVKGGNFDLDALANGDNVRIGASYDSWSSVTLYEGEPGNWFSAQPNACAGGGSGGGGSGGGSGFICQDWYDNNYNHVQAGRASGTTGYAVTIGGNDNLGLYNTYTMSYVKETASGFFEQGQCP